MSKSKEHPTVDSVTAEGNALTDRWQAKADQLHADWMTKLAEMLRDYPDTPEPALMRMALQAARLEAEINDRHVERQWLQTNGSALAEHMEKQAIDRERAPRKQGGKIKNEETNAIKEICKQALKNDPSIYNGNTNTHAATILATRAGFAVNGQKNADDDRRRGKGKGSLTIKTVAEWIGEWKRLGEI